MSTTNTTSATTAATFTGSTRRWPLWVAAALAAVITALHLFGGTPQFLDPLLRSNLDAPVTQLFRVL